MRISSLCLVFLVGALAVHGASVKKNKLRARLQKKTDPSAGAGATFNYNKNTMKKNAKGEVEKKKAAGTNTGDAGEAWFPLKSVNTYQCATLHFNHKKQLNEVVQKPCQGAGADGQMWVVRSDRQIENKELAGNCMTVLKARKAAGNKVILRPCMDTGEAPGSTSNGDTDVHAHLDVTTQDGAQEWSRFEFTPLARQNHQISFASKRWSFYCLGINDFDHNIRIYGCDATHPYQQWKFDANQYLKIPRCNSGDFPEEQVRCGDQVYLYQANKNSVAWIRMPPGDDRTVSIFTKMPERKPWKIECSLEKEGDRMYEGAGMCLKQNRRYLTLDGGLHWTQEKHCNLDLPDSWQNMRITNTDKAVIAEQEEVNKGAVMYACRDQSDTLHNYVSLTGEYYGTQHDPTPVWMRIGADARVSTTVAEGHAETHIFLLPVM